MDEIPPKILDNPQQYYVEDLDRRVLMRVEPCGQCQLVMKAKLYNTPCKRKIGFITLVGNSGIAASSASWRAMLPETDL